MNKENNKNIGYLIFIVSPIISFIYALKFYRKKESKNILWAFIVFFGYTFQITENYIGDAVRYKDKFLETYNIGTSYKSLFSNFLSNTQNMEIVERFISTTVSKFTDNYHFLYMFYGVFFGYFFSRNIYYIYKYSDNCKVKNLWVLVLLLFSTIPFWNINGFDFWAASQVFIFGITPFLIEKKTKKLWLLLITPFIHFSFYILLPVIISFYFVRNKYKLLIVFFISSFLIFNLPLEIFSNLIKTYMPDLIVRRSEAYIAIDDAESRQSGGRIMSLAVNLARFSIYLIFLYFYRNHKEVIINSKYSNLLFFSIFFISIFNILSVIPSINRFINIGNWLLVSSLILVIFELKSNSQISEFIYLRKKINFFKPIFLFLSLLIIARYLLPVLGLGSIFSNIFVVNYFVNDDIVIGNVYDLIL